MGKKLEEIYSPQTNPQGDLLTALPADGEDIVEDESDDEDYFLDLSMDDEDAPEKAERMLNVFGGPVKASRRVRNGPGSTHMPDFAKMVSVGPRGRNQDSMNKPFDNDFIFSPLPEQNTTADRPRLTNDIQKMMTSMSDSDKFF